MTAGLECDIAASDAVDAARRLSPPILEAREETERLRQIPPALADALASAGLYQLYLPHVLGGPELPPLTVFEAIEETSKADGSVGWCLMNANLIALAAGWLEPEIGRKNSSTPHVAMSLTRWPICGRPSAPTGPIPAGK
jgi:indole-3-acetate monooxygenase